METTNPPVGILEPRHHPRNSPRGEFERRQHLTRVATLYCRGKRQHEIAEELGFSRQQITYDLKVLEKTWERSGILNIQEAKMRELAKIDELERTYWDCFTRSMAPRQTKKVSQTDEDMTKTVIEQNQVGDPRWGERIEWCINKRCAILGLEKIDEYIGETAHAFAAKVQDDLRKAREATLGNMSVSANGQLVEHSNDTTMDNNQGG